MWWIIGKNNKGITRGKSLVNGVFGVVMGGLESGEWEAGEW